uniref:Uncharacterized protein n=1 Tax=Palpitomonas bilix TaxID=652834 RepID=A0A7S3G5D5_9EUKA|mmetsp:Transcript_20304/g.51981  ORF Transcript_20304/g.51981 Transcript_20304/m.51981 type:complete len:297 (+) Transcript_20304:1807-2697(+)
MKKNGDRLDSIYTILHDQAEHIKGMAEISTLVKVKKVSDQGCQTLADNSNVPASACNNCAERSTTMPASEATADSTAAQSAGDPIKTLPLSELGEKCATSPLPASSTCCSTERVEASIVEEVRENDHNLTEQERNEQDVTPSSQSKLVLSVVQVHAEGSSPKKGNTSVQATEKAVEPPLRSIADDVARSPSASQRKEKKVAEPAQETRPHTVNSMQSVEREEEASDVVVVEETPVISIKEGSRPVRQKQKTFSKFTTLKEVPHVPTKRVQRGEEIAVMKKIHMNLMKKTVKHFLII